MSREAEEMLNNKCPYIKRKIVLGKILTVKSVTGQRNLGSLTKKIKCEWENHVKREELRLSGEQELDRT
jgi:hypothetical protein